MRKLVLHMAISTDGFVGGPKGEIDWIFKSMDDEATAWTIEALQNAGVNIMGRRTFYDMAAYWPYSSDPIAAPMNEIPKVVFSSRPLKPSGGGKNTRALLDAKRARSSGGSKATAAQSALAAEWMKSHVAQGGLDQEISKLKRQGGKYILAHGGAGFAQSLVKSGQIDEYRLRIHPVALGRGFHLFSALSRPLDLELVSSTKFKAGAVGLIYRPA